MPERVEVRSVKNGTPDFIEVPSAQEAYLDALVRERDGYARYGKADRALAVQEEIDRLQGGAPQEPAQAGKRPAVRGRKVSEGVNQDD